MAAATLTCWLASVPVWAYLRAQTQAGLKTRLYAGSLAQPAKGAGVDAAGWVLAAILMVTIVRPAFGAVRVIPAVSTDLYQAGRWVRANVGAACVDYIVANADTAYWLHLAVLGNPRASSRAVELDRYDPHAAIGHWVASDGPLG